jgi:outer membrane PBP1 activator LpoA protein
VVSSLRQLLNEPTTRELDALFVATPVLSAQIRPVMAYYHTAALPLYTVAAAYDAAAADITHQDQNGLRFCDQPWIVLGGWPEQDELYASSRPGSSYDRLYGFGGDAYSLVKALYRGGSIDLAGRTGHLGIGADGRVQRDFSCVELRNGHPEVLAAPGNVPAATPGT